MFDDQNTSTRLSQEQLARQATELEQVQVMLEKKIYEYANAIGLSSEDLEPITDGVYDAQTYLSTPRKIMWIMKEPYDEIINGKPLGGGWNLAKDCFAKSNAWSNRSWQPIIYSMYGVKHNCLYSDMDWIRDDHSMADVLQEIAYINVSKMPNLTGSDDKYIGVYYNMWKPFLFEQINAYSPDIMIFAGTFKHFSCDLQPDLHRLGDVIYKGKKNGDLFEWHGKYILSVLHPNNRSITRELYVNSIIDAIRCLPDLHD